MASAKKVMSGCLLAPVVLFVGCAANVKFAFWRYDLPGEVLRSPLKPTHTLDAPMQVAEALDAYVQPRFEILRDLDFGELRLVYRRHAGIVQLKVDTPQEQQAIADINGAHRDYAISLLHCAPKPNSTAYKVKPKLHLLYFNQEKLVYANAYMSQSPRQAEVAADHHFDLVATEEKAVAALPQLLAGKEQRTETEGWTVLMRPVRAFKQECLSCHTEAKPGATLGVMVYAVRKTRNDVTMKIGMR